MIIDNILRVLVHLIIPLVLTIFAEGLIIFVFFRRWEYVYYILLLNILTNPLLNFILLIYYSYIGMEGYYIVLYIMETVVVITEGLIFAKLTDIKILKALVVSLFVNAGSYLTGLILL